MIGMGTPNSHKSIDRIIRSLQVHRINGSFQNCSRSVAHEEGPRHGVCDRIAKTLPAHAGKHVFRVHSCRAQ